MEKDNKFLVYIMHSNHDSIHIYVWIVFVLFEYNAYIFRKYFKDVCNMLENFKWKKITSF